MVGAWLLCRASLPRVVVLRVGDVASGEGPAGLPVEDLPHGSVPLHLWVCKRRFVCREQLCSRGSFTEVSDQVPARSRLTMR